MTDNVGTSERSLAEAIWEMGRENCTAKRVGVSKDQLLAAAKALNLRGSNKSKEELADMIFAFKDHQEAIKVASELRAGHRRTLNTFPRLCNFLMESPDALARVQLLASRFQLDSGEVYHEQRIFVDAVEKFNDKTLSSRGLVQVHQAYAEKKINPDLADEGELTTEKAYKIFMNVKKSYSEAKRRFHASGQNGNDFFEFCGNDCDVLYLHHWIVKLGNPDLTTFCESGSIIPAGFDSSSTTPSIVGSKRKDDGEGTRSAQQLKLQKRFVELKEQSEVRRVKTQKGKDNFYQVQTIRALFDMQRENALLLQQHADLNVVNH